MKKDVKPVNSNSISISGIVTFCKALNKKDGSVWGYDIGVKVPYIGNNGKEFSAYPIFRLNTTEHGEPERGDEVSITAHFETHKFNDKFTTSYVVDSIE